jgi:hypothetical protein
MSKSDGLFSFFKCGYYYGAVELLSKDSFTAKADRPLDLYLVI